MSLGAYSQLYTGNNTDKLVKEVKDYEKNAEIVTLSVAVVVIFAAQYIKSLHFLLCIT